MKKWILLVPAIASLAVGTFILVKKEMFEGKIKRGEANRLMKECIKEGFELLINNGN